MHGPVGLRIGFVGLLTALASCSAGSSDPGIAPGTGGSSGSADGGGGMSDGGGIDAGSDAIDPDSCTPHCSANYRNVLGCGESVVTACGADQMCADATCRPACEAANVIGSSVGCDYFAVPMQGYTGSDGGCFAVFVANTWFAPAHVNIDFRGSTLHPQSFGYLPKRTSSGITYEPYDASVGVAPGAVAVFFLFGPGPNGSPSGVDCPYGTTPAVIDPSIQKNGTAIGDAFHIGTDVPVVAYQMLPYGGGDAAVTGASLLLPTSVWDTNYVAVNAYAATPTNMRPSLNLIAMEDGTQVTMVPRVKVAPGTGIAGADANTVMTINLQRGQHAQISQVAELTGSVIQSDKPIALMAGHECMQVPFDRAFCDHAEQQIPPVRALGHEYVAVSHRQRSSVAEKPTYRIVGAVDGTQLVFDPPSAHASQTIGVGQVVEFVATQPFTVSSQDAAHPFVVTTYMTGSSTVQEGYGDPDFVRLVPPRQYLQRYVFFTDPTYPETNLVIVREKGPDGFADVELDCGPGVEGWAPVGSSGRFEFTRVDLVRHDFEPQGGCNNGVHEMTSTQPFGLWVWGWGTPETSAYSANVSYGYPAGESVLQLNNVIIPPVPK